MWQQYVYIVLSLIFVISGIIIGWGLTFSDYFKHIDSKTQEKKITWWLVCLVAISSAFTITIISSVLYKKYYGGTIFDMKQTIWTNPWSHKIKYSSDYSPMNSQNNINKQVNQPKQSYLVEYPDIPETRKGMMDTVGIL